jgi:adenosine deaminase
MFFDPQAHTAAGVSYDTVIRGIRRVKMEVETWLGIRSQLIMCFLRLVRRRIIAGNCSSGGTITL